MRNEAYKSSKRSPYIHDNYNVRAYWKSTPSTTIKSVIGRIYNSLVEALNNNIRLPQFILVIPGRDILRKAAFYNFGASLVIGDNVEWLIDNFTKAIETRKIDMRNICPGTVASSKPKIVWVKMLSRPGKERLQKLRSKYNEIMEEYLTNHKYSYSLDADQALTPNHFDHNNRLNPVGQHQLWCFIDEQMKKFDRQQVDLKPHKVITIARKQKCQEHQQRQHYILPRPPTVRSSSQRKEDHRANIEDRC